MKTQTMQLPFRMDIDLEYCSEQDQQTEPRPIAVFPVVHWEVPAGKAAVQPNSDYDVWYLTELVDATVHRLLRWGSEGAERLVCTDVSERN